MFDSKIKASPTYQASTTKKITFNSFNSTSHSTQKLLKNKNEEEKPSPLTNTPIAKKTFTHQGSKLKKALPIIQKRVMFFSCVLCYLCLKAQIWIALGTRNLYNKIKRKKDQNKIERQGRRKLAQLTKPKTTKKKTPLKTQTSGGKTTKKKLQQNKTKKRDTKLMFAFLLSSERKINLLIQKTIAFFCDVTRSNKKKAQQIKTILKNMHTDKKYSLRANFCPFFLFLFYFFFFLCNCNTNKSIFGGVSVIAKRRNNQTITTIKKRKKKFKNTQKKKKENSCH
ncbi:hypothetical protein RFI_25368 [Reticulomyxa filosa]|uniref:Transmembrane protein n=1 Tax=Reticulomyxa filosa TaxID=46433 RepID=X6MG42_RETFI|nr:hypothetical protein RFI_25368 [Reticulomyxa filosa]|eukprot:ETO12010.1 hypothetical protein RFI_25368 [Reticulomyxa filosa]